MSSRDRLGLIGTLLAALLLVAVPARGGEEDVYREVMRRYERVNAELMDLVRELDCPAPLSPAPKRVLSYRKTAGVTIGGEFRTSYIGSKASYTDPDPGDHYQGRVKSNSKFGDLSVTTANLYIDARTGGRWRGFFDLNLHGHYGYHRTYRTANPNEPGTANPTTRYRRYSSDFELIEEAYIELLKDGHSGFGFKAGLIKLPFGLSDKPKLLGRSYMDAPDLTGSYLMHPESWDNGVLLPHASRFIDPSVSLLLSYEMRDIIRFEAGIFQERDRKFTHNYESGGTRHYRDDSVALRSWLVGFSILPLEGWELTAHLRNRYSKSRGVQYWSNSPYRWDFRRNMASGRHDPSWDPVAGQWSDNGGGLSFGSRSNEQAFIVGLAVEIPNTNLTVQAEYAHGWNQGFNKYLNSDGVNVGLAYRLTPALTLHAQGEWLHLKDRSWVVAYGDGWTRDTRNNRLYRVLLGAEYEFFRGLTAEAGWQYEYWNLTSSNGGEGGVRDRRTNTAHMFYAGTRFIF